MHEPWIIYILVIEFMVLIKLTDNGVAPTPLVEDDDCIRHFGPMLARLSLLWMFQVQPIQFSTMKICVGLVTRLLNCADLANKIIMSVCCLISYDLSRLWRLYIKICTNICLRWGWNWSFGAEGQILDRSWWRLVVEICSNGLSTRRDWAIWLCQCPHISHWLSQRTYAMDYGQWKWR